MRPIIEFCTNNMHHGTDQVMAKLEGDLAYDVIDYGCLGNCGQCFAMPYALVNGEMVTANDPDELYDKIMQAIESQEDMFEWLDLD